MTTSSLTHLIALAAPVAQQQTTSPNRVSWSASLGINDTKNPAPIYTFKLTYGNGSSFTNKFKADRNFWEVWKNNEPTLNIGNVAKTYAPGDGFSDGDDKRSIASPRGGIVTLNAGAGNDFIFVANQGTALNANMGDGMDFALGGLLNDSIRGGDGDDVLFGAAGNDTLCGDAGKDVIDGGDGEDRIRGGADNDRIRGGRGSDALYGDKGADVFVFNHTDYTASTVENDTIFDFQSDDRINLKDLKSRFGVNIMERIELINQGGFAKLLVDLDDKLGADLTIQIKGMSYADFSQGMNKYLQF